MGTILFVIILACCIGSQKYKKYAKRQRRKERRRILKLLAGIDVNANKKAADEKRAEAAAKALGQDQEMQLLTNSDSGKDDPN